MINNYIEGLSGIYGHLETLEQFEKDLKGEIFIQDNIKLFLSGFDYITFDIIALLKISTERLGKTLADLSDGKINKKDVEFYQTQAQRLIEHRRLLRNEFENMNILLLKEGVNLYADTKLDDAFGKMKNFMNVASDIPLILGELKENFKRSDDDIYFFFEPRTIEYSRIIDKIEERSSVIQISPVITFDKVNGIFGKIGSDLEYRLNSQDREIFMAVLLEKSINGNYVNYDTFAEALGLDRYDDGGKFGQRMPPRTKEKIRELYKALRRSLEKGLAISEGESDFCGGAEGGYRLPFLTQR